MQQSMIIPANPTVLRGTLNHGKSNSVLCGKEKGKKKRLCSFTISLLEKFIGIISKIYFSEIGELFKSARKYI